MLTLNSNGCQEVYIADPFPHIQCRSGGIREDEVFLVSKLPSSRCNLVNFWIFFLMAAPSLKFMSRSFNWLLNSNSFGNSNFFPLLSSIFPSHLPFPSLVFFFLSCYIAYHAVKANLKLPILRPPFLKCWYHFISVPFCFLLYHNGISLAFTRHSTSQLQTAVFLFWDLSGKLLLIPEGLDSLSGLHP